MQLDRVDGPTCRQCGCQDSRILRRTSRWGQPHERRRCEYCGYTWSVAVSKDKPEPTTVVPRETRGVIFRYGETRCPKCGGTDTPVTTTRKPIRHHKCRGCGHRFKSAEREGKQ